MNIKLFLVLFLLLVSILFISSCKHHPYNNGELITDTICDPQTVYFQNTIWPILNSKCGMSGCHNTTTHAEGINMTSYATIMSSGEGGFIIPYDPNGSKLYHSVIDGSMPPNPFSNLTSNEIQSIYDWINQGAWNNYCAECDTNAFTFASSIYPIFLTRCEGCHGNTSPGGGIILTNYTTIKTQVNNYEIQGVLTDHANYPVMPPSVGLPNCETTKIMKWINNGALNN